MATSSLRVGEKTGVWARWQMPTHQPLCVTENWCVGELLNAHTPAPPCGKTDVWAIYVTHHTHALSYVAQKISQIVSRFVHIVLDGDGCVWSRWSTPTRVGVNIFWVPITATRVGVKRYAHTFFVVPKRTSPHACVWAKQLAPTRLLFPSRSLLNACVWAK